MMEQAEDESITPWDDALNSAEEALDDGDPLAACQHLKGLPAEEAVVACLHTEALLELDRLAEARQALERGRFEEADPDRLWLEGQILLREWRIAEAERAFGELCEAEPNPNALSALALCRELEGDFASADGYLRAASELDPEAFPPIARLDEDAFDAIVQQALGELPDEFRSVLEHLGISVQPMPHSELSRVSGEVPPDLLGLFCGPTLGELGEAHAEVPLVYLFQRNIERVARDLEELQLEIRTTLYHEIGHFLGHDEDGVEAIGLG